MCNTKLFVIFLICAFASLVACSENEDYYWRPWTAGSPPADAISGRDHRGMSYVIEGFVPNCGEYIGQSFSNQHEVNVSTVHANTTQNVQRSYAVKVLCSQNKDKLFWYPTNSTVLENELLTGAINPVIGGYDGKEGVLYVGRYVDIALRMAFFGSVCDVFNIHYSYNGKSYIQTDYEILVVDNKKCS